MRSVLLVALGVLVCACTTPSVEEVVQFPPLTPSQAVVTPKGELKVEIRNPAPDLTLTNWETSIEVEGGASVFGGVRFLDLILVLDTSKSLRRNDPRDYRTLGAAGLVENLPAKSDVQIGVVDFDSNGELALPLTADRAAVIESLHKLDQSGRTNIAAGIRLALEEFSRNARPDSSRVILLFTDGLSNAKKAREAMDEAQQRGVAIHTLLLGSSKKGTAILRELAEGTGASFVRVTDPAKLPEAFLNLRTTGVDSVSLRVNDSPPIPTQLIGGTFSAQVPLRMGENRLVATALSLDGETQTDAVTFVVSGPIDFAIYTPEDGALVESRKTEMLVGGVVDSLVGLPAEATQDYFQLGVERVVLSVNDSPPSAAIVEDGRFEGRVRLQEGDNRIVAVATTRDGRTASDEIAVTVQVPGCAELHVTAVSNGRPTLSVSDRAVEIVVDASNSMWGQLDGRAKIEVAKEILQDALGWLPRDLMLALRVYGHQHKRELRVCTDSELLVPFGSGSRGRIHDAIATFRPKGQTPLAYSLKQVGADFGEFQGERAVVLVTDGIESCGGNPVEAARTLQERENVPVHVIGFGLGTQADEDLGSLQAIADASGGRFLTARSAQELRDALSVTVGTPFHVFRGQTVVGHGALGDARPMLLPEGDYRLRLESAPPREVPLTLEREEGLTLVLERKESTVSYVVERGRADYTPCEPTATALDDDRIPGEAEQQGAAKPLAP